MSAKKHKVPESGSVWHQSAVEATLASKPYVNGFACGYGAHGDTKYNRNKAKHEWKRRIADEGASRGSFPFLGTYAKTAECARGALTRATRSQS